MSDVCPGIAMTREFHNTFGCHIEERPRALFFNESGEARIRWWAGQLAMMAEALKREAAEMNAAGQEATGLALVRLQLDVEETSELFEAVADGDIVEIFDALIDKSYVTDGSFHTFGLGRAKLEGYREVHSSNMSKVGEDGKPIIEESGRVGKGPNYRKPDLEPILRAAGADL